MQIVGGCFFGWTTPLPRGWGVSQWDEKNSGWAPPAFQPPSLPLRGGGGVTTCLRLQPLRVVNAVLFNFLAAHVEKQPLSTGAENVVCEICCSSYCTGPSRQSEGVVHVHAYISSGTGWCILPQCRNTCSQSILTGSWGNVGAPGARRASFVTRAPPVAF